jgi:hypothetical protein
VDADGTWHGKDWYLYNQADLEYKETIWDPDFQEMLWWSVDELQGDNPYELYGRDDWQILDPNDEIHPSLMQEFTYMFVNPYNMPDHGQPGTSSFAFPIGTTWDHLWDPFGYGLETFDADFDGIEEICRIHSEQSLAKVTGVEADFNGDGFLQQLDIDGIELTGDEIVVFAADNINLFENPIPGQSKWAMFLDHMVEVTRVTEDQVTFRFWKTGGTAAGNVPGDFGTYSLRPGEMALVRHGDMRMIIPAGGGNTVGNNPGWDLDPDGAWFVYLQGHDDNADRCVVTLGRALGRTWTVMDQDNHDPDLQPGDPWYMKRFYVDGHEYDVVAIKTVCERTYKEEDFEFKYITIRTEIPKYAEEPDDPVIIEQHSVQKQHYVVCEDHPKGNISVMPPFNYDHTCKRDIQEGWSDPGWLSDHDYKGEVIKNKPPVIIHLQDETREPQFKGELKEKYDKRPIIDLTIVTEGGNTGAITGWIDGRSVMGTATNDPTTPEIWDTWELWDAFIADDIIPIGPLFNDNLVSRMHGKFELYDWDDDGVDEFIMCYGQEVHPEQYFRWNRDIWLEIQNEVGFLTEDYLCFFAENTPGTNNYIWYDDYEVWMTEQWHTIPDLYTELNFQYIPDDPNDYTDQLYMLTSSWYAPETKIRIPYYEEGALGGATFVEIIPIYIPFTFADSMQIWLDGDDIAMTLYNPLGTAIIVGADEDNPITVWTPMPGLWRLSVFDNGIPIANEPEEYSVLIEVRATGARVKFWYDPTDCDDIYVNTVVLGEHGPPPSGTKGDFDDDGCIDNYDFAMFGLAYGSQLGDGNYNALADFDDDGFVDNYDFAMFGLIYGQGCP